MAKNLKALGKVYDYTCTGDVTSGQVIVMQDTIGVALANGKTGDVIAVHVEAVFELPKGSGGIAQGKKVYWDATNSVITTTATSNTYAGKAYATAASNDATVQVSLNA